MKLKRTIRTIVMTVAVVYMMFIFASLCKFTLSNFNEIIKNEVEQKLNYKVELTSTKLNNLIFKSSDTNQALKSKEVKEVLTKMKGSGEEHYFILDKEGRFAASENPKFIVGKAMSEESDRQLSKIGQVIASTEGTNGMGDSENVYAFTSIGDTGYKLVLSMPLNQIYNPMMENLYLIIGGFVFAMAIFAVLLFIILTRYVVRPLRTINKHVMELVEQGGDLTQKLNMKRQDEIGMLAYSINQFLDNLRGIVGNVMNGANHVNENTSLLQAAAEQMDESSKQVTTIIADMADRSTQQAEHVRQVLTMMERTEEISAEVKRETEKTVGDSQHLLQAVQTGQSANRASVDNLEEMVSSIRRSTETIGELNYRSNEIGEIITVISELASQTNLLALNAAIEAARAGEHGAGFAVVAGEVRKLAEGSGRAAEQITELIRKIQAETNAAVKLMEANQRVVILQNDLVMQGQESLEMIVMKVDLTVESTLRIQHIFNELSTTSQESMEALMQSSKLIDESASASQEVVASTEEQHATVDEMISKLKELSNVSLLLKREVGKFTI
ncbi:methyl-accepting chemotaxis protein [Paenibacillus sp. SYP-B3998]|uniref:Methyl-accepting chemotaxis protein n=1 Tax=Paenibacillus sp. SYP-B3998 TaxID=2678564 RepID=A0A6G3ZWK2_9BACL|nr:methyl-accepting chemotaxis protein [Paenibacillus sp. SYP-B3998]NEW05969.1 methyl-accepting chemotaxis protein [Paenibacillus sp. SYP-B3998]